MSLILKKYYIFKMHLFISFIFVSLHPENSFFESNEHLFDMQ